MNAAIPPLDLGWLLMESPGGTTHVGAMLLFKKPPGRSSLVREVVEAYRGYRPQPPFNYIPELLGGGVPHFREVDSWDPHYHVQHLSLPTHSTYQDLLRLIADLHEPMLDRHRPMFRCWLIDGVPGGRFAIYTKTHHSIIDGVSRLRKLYEGLTPTDEPAIPTPPFAMPHAPPEPSAPTPALRRLTHAIRGAVTQLGAVNQISLSALQKTLSAALGSHLEGSLPFVAAHAPTNPPPRQARGFATLSLPVHEMHRIGHQHGATLNDVAATIIDHGLHAYLRETGQVYPHEFIAMCPVSLRDDGDSAVGTRVSAMFVRLGRPEASIVDRLRQVVHSVATAKAELGAMSADAAMTYAVALITLAGAGATTHLDRIGHPACNLVISNVPGGNEIRYLNGARLLGIYPVSALAASIGLNVTLSSYCDHMDFGFVANSAAISDVPALAEHTRKAYAEFRSKTRVL
ncbi:wax ester/triacylglycerol synthase family O-acyltransferase [Mycolicibacterium duvalii]|uniref:Diacylglycerol O-acyltransferase n=1 Tax=Mycolicibacterium duvalii TaxID=39688 RepID=A0A7I7JY93_9MYCO|nr:wax ester/triacylglycerol synthase family O-acyltransferase [Mycolicibacterium duvalii]MCV7369543.1 wax ester/triacylglycerol synthase family O-acyltransferase [Mycolicibacterium duvalii]PEG42244.1 wax ester/triacylglycerol synthase family O-acyltransferase [Mycolicibacterium duvalii]BBX16264.1 diacylglycerol O-acyltransferase [Mycolicibacterium duvalii]